MYGNNSVTLFFLERPMRELTVEELDVVAGGKRIIVDF